MSQYWYYQERSSFGSSKITWAVQRLMFLNIGIFAVQVLLDPVVVLVGMITPFHYIGNSTVPGMPGGIVSEWLGFQPQLFARGYIWKPFSYQFLHGGIMHLFMNMLWLYFFGPEVERSLGTRQFFRFFILCGAVGVLTTLVPWGYGMGSVSVVGASGSVMGVMVAFVVLDPDREFHLIPFPFPINARALVLIVVVMNIISGLGNNRVSVLTHFGGMGAGYLYMKLMPRFNAWQRKSRLASPVKKKKKKGGGDKVGDAVDSIFDFKDKGRR